MLYDKKNPEHDMIYTGFFVNKTELEEILKKTTGHSFSLEKPIEFPHVTTEFRPGAVNKQLFGSEVNIIIDGYAKDAKNEGFRVKLESDDFELQKEIVKTQREGHTPHITLSVSSDGKPVDTVNLEFEDIEPVEIVGTFGGFNKNGKVDTEREISREELDKQIRDLDKDIEHTSEDVNYDIK